jgi:hypothetical protein
MLYTYTRTRTNFDNEGFKDIAKSLNVIYQYLDDVVQNTKNGETGYNFTSHPDNLAEMLGSGMVTGPDFNIQKIDLYGDNPMIDYISECWSIHLSRVFNFIGSSVTLPSGRNVSAIKISSDIEAQKFLKTIILRIQQNTLEATNQKSRKHK